VRIEQAAIALRDVGMSPHHTFITLKGDDQMIDWIIEWIFKPMVFIVFLLLCICGLVGFFVGICLVLVSIPYGYAVVLSGVILFSVYNSIS